MVRLTKVDGIGQNEIIKCFDCDLEKAGTELEHCGYCEHWQAVVDRLAAYEDTGLEPEEIVKMGMAYEDSKRYSGRLEGKLQAYRTLGTVEELSALVKARDEGRLVVLPCKVGDTVYWMWTDSEGNCEAPIHADRIYEIPITKDGVELSIQPYDGSIGKVGIHPPLAVFLTRAEAEAALGGGGDG